MVVLLGAGPAAAQSIENFELDTAADLLDVCAPAPGSPEADAALAFCYGYIVGGADLYARLVQAKAIEPWACAEPVPQLTEIRNAYVDWARSHRSALGGDPADAFWQAMTSAYPCK
jgi:Rap1a immunity proteins